MMFNHVTKCILITAILSPILLCVPVTGKDRSDLLQKYKDGVSSLNLINGLHLSTKQLKDLLRLNMEMQDLEDKVTDSEHYKFKKKNAVKSMKKLFYYLIDNPETENRDIVHKASSAVHKYKEFIRRKTQSNQPQIEKICKEAEELLTAEQLEVVDTFKSCIAPPKEMSDPIRAGQAKQSTHTLRTLTKIRRMRNRKDVAREAEHLADRNIDITIKYYYKMTEKEIKQRHKEIVKLIKQAHAMSDTDFELKKETIAEQIEPSKNKLKKLYNEAKQRNPYYKKKSQKVNHKVKRFLLNHHVMITILKGRLKANRHGGLR